MLSITYLRLTYSCDLGKRCQVLAIQIFIRVSSMYQSLCILAQDFIATKKYFTLKIYFGPLLQRLFPTDEQKISSFMTGFSNVCIFRSLIRIYDDRTTNLGKQLGAVYYLFICFKGFDESSGKN